MGTNGAFGFFYKGKYYVCYNHNDSYPEYLGLNLIYEILNTNFEEWKKLLDNMIIVDSKAKPTQDVIEKLAEFTDLGVSNGTTDDWYCLLRGTQGSFNNVLRAGHIENFVDKDGKPDKKVYGYIVNFDNNTFEFNDPYKKENSVVLPLDHDILKALEEKWKH